MQIPPEEWDILVFLVCVCVCVREREREIQSFNSLYSIYSDYKVLAAFSVLYNRFL